MHWFLKLLELFQTWRTRRAYMTSGLFLMVIGARNWNAAKHWIQCPTRIKLFRVSENTRYVCTVYQYSYTCDKRDSPCETMDSGWLYLRHLDLERRLFRWSKYKRDKPWPHGIAHGKHPLLWLSRLSWCIRYCFSSSWVHHDDLRDGRLVRLRTHISRKSVHPCIVYNIEDAGCKLIKLLDSHFTP